MENRNGKFENFLIFFIICAIIIALFIVFYNPKKEEKQNISPYISVVNDNIVLKVGETIKLDIDSNIAVTYDSDNYNIASVNSSGVVSGISSGNTFIIIKSVDQKLKKQINVNVISEDKIKVAKTTVESSNEFSKSYVKNGDNLIITLEFEQKLTKKLDVLVNNEKLVYTFIPNQKKIVVQKEVKNETSLSLKVYDSNNLIYTYSLPKVDNKLPQCTLKVNGEYLKIEGTDNYGIGGYSISQGKSPNYNSSTMLKFDNYGTWYGYVRDYAGNEGSCSVVASKPSTPTPSNNEPKEVTINPANITMVGDSRTVGICENNWYQVEKGNCIAEIGMGYNWFISVAIPRVDALTDSNKKYIVINLGGNDLENIDYYLAKYKELATGKWKKFMIFLGSVNPTDGEVAYANGYIDNFNSKLKSFTNQYSNISYCDTNTYLKQHGFKTFDGIHYYENISKAIYEQTKKCIYDYYN